MKEQINELLANVDKNVTSEDELLKLTSNRIISEVNKLLNDYRINFKIYALQLIVERLIYYGCKTKLNKYINNINEVKKQLEDFHKIVLDKGSNSLECNEKAINLDNAFKAINNINYNDEFATVKKAILDMLNIGNPQLNIGLDSVLNNSRLFLETECLKIRNQNQEIFATLVEKVKKLYLINDNKNINSNSLIDTIQSYLINYNKQNETLKATKIKQYLNNSSIDISNQISKYIRLDKIVLAKEISNIMLTSFNINYEIYNQRLNNKFINTLINRLKDLLKTEKHPEISRDSVIYKDVKQFAYDEDFIDLNKVFANIEKLLNIKYSLHTSNPKYNNIIGFLNTKKSEIDTLFQKLENKILLNNIIEMQSQINRILK